MRNGGYQTTMNLNHLLYFETLAKTNNFSVAAERCYTTQPNLSYGIKALEEELGVKLIERTNRKIRLTQAGELYLPYAEAAIAELREGGSLLKEWQDKSAVTPLRIGGKRMSYFSEIISRLLMNENNDNIAFNAYSYSFAHTEEEVLNGNLDIGIGYWRPEEQNPELVYIPLKLPDLILVVDERHPLADSSSVSLWQIRDYRIIRKASGSTTSEIDALYQKAGFSPIVFENAPTLMSVLGLVESRMGITLITDTRDVDAFRVKKIRIDWPKQDFLYSLFFRKNAPFSWAMHLVCTYIINENGVDPKASLKLLSR